MRPQLDRITVEFIDHLAATEEPRRPTPRCTISLALAEAKTDLRDDLDRLHDRALRGAVKRLCT